MAEFYRTITLSAEHYTDLAQHHTRKPSCESCGSENITVYDCTGYLNGETGEWELSDLADNDTKCNDCGLQSTMFRLEEHIGPFYLIGGASTSNKTADYILEKKFTRDDLPGIISVIEAVIEKFEHYVMPQGRGEEVDRAWDEINTAMAFLCEELGVER